MCAGGDGGGLVFGGPAVEHLREAGGAGLADAFRHRNPGVLVRVREADLADPTTGLRAGLVDVALTRMPFDRTGISTRELRSDPVGVVLRVDDPLARRSTRSDVPRS